MARIYNPCISKPEKAKAFDDNLNQLSIAKIWDSFKEAHGYEKDKETNYFKLSHQLGKDVITVASLFIGVGELSALAKTGKLAKTVSLTKNISKLSKVVSSGAIKILKKSPKLAGLLKKLPKTIVAEVQKIGFKSYLILKVKTTTLAKISDEAVFSEMKLLQEGAIVKYTDGSDIVFTNAKYIDNGVEQTGTLSIVKNGDEVGVKLADAGGEVLPEVFGGARQYVRNTYPNGQDILNSLTQKFGSNQGAAAEIIKKFGDDGLAIVNKPTINSINDIVNELLKNKTAYRHIGSNVSYLEQLKSSGRIPRQIGQGQTYFSLDKINDPIVAIDKMQLNAKYTDAVWRAEFDATQLVGKTSFPKGKWGNAEYVEVLTRSYPNFGSGGASQFITQSPIKLKRLVNLRTGEIINFK